MKTVSMKCRQWDGDLFRIGPMVCAKDREKPSQSRALVISPRNLRAWCCPGSTKESAAGGHGFQLIRAGAVPEQNADSPITETVLPDSNAKLNSLLRNPQRDFGLTFNGIPEIIFR
jgi:hypothetical protein